MLKRIMEEMPMAGVILDRKGVIEFCNGSLLEMSGRRMEEVLGRCWFETFVPEYKRTSSKSEYLMAMESGLSRNRYESVILSRTGIEIDVLWRCSVRRDVQGNTCGIIKFGLNLKEISGFGNNNSSPKQYESIGLAVSGLVHDLNNLFFPILNYSQTIMGRTILGSELNDCARNIKLAGEKGKLLAEQMLLALRNGYAPTKLEKLDIAGFVSGWGGKYCSLLGGDISLVIDVGSKNATILADRSMIERMLLNLAFNAKDAMPVGGKISIALSEASVEGTVECHGSELNPGVYVVLLFSDNGYGMTGEMLKRIFEPFFTSKKNGNGIGLANVLDIVSMHGAHIQVASTPGAGTTFRIYFRKVEMGTNQKKNA